MAKSRKQPEKGILKCKKSKKNTQKAGCKCSAPLFTGGSSCKAPVLFVGGTSNLHYPINMHVADPRGGVSIYQPNMKGGKSKRKGKRNCTRKRISHK